MKRVLKRKRESDFPAIFASGTFAHSCEQRLKRLLQLPMFCEGVDVVLLLRRLTCYCEWLDIENYLLLIIDWIHVYCERICQSDEQAKSFTFTNNRDYDAWAIVFVCSEMICKLLDDYYLVRRAPLQKHIDAFLSFKPLTFAFVERLLLNALQYDLSYTASDDILLASELLIHAIAIL